MFNLNIIFYYCIIFVWISFVFYCIFLFIFKDCKRVSRDCIGQMVSFIYNKGYVGGNYVKFIDNEFIFNKIKQIFDVFFKVLDIFKVIVVGVIFYYNIGIFNDIFEKIKLIVMW